MIIVIVTFAFSMSVTTEFPPSKIDIAIIGAGPQALTLVTHLLQKR